MASNLRYTNNLQEVNCENETFRSSRSTQGFMEAYYMVSYFASNNSDSDLADACNRPPGPHVTATADSPDECGFKPAQPVKHT